MWWVLADHWSKNDEEALAPLPYPGMLGASLSGLALNSKWSGGGVLMDLTCAGLGDLVRRCFLDPHGEDCVNPEQARRLASTIGDQVGALAQTDEVVYNTEIPKSLSSVEVDSVRIIDHFYAKQISLPSIGRSLPNRERGCCCRSLPNSEGR